MIIKGNNLQTLTALHAPEKNKEPEDIFKKLSSGKIASLFKIDEPSVINETMKVKMRELDLNARYAQEAVAVAQTAQEGLDKIQNNLERMKELVAMASEDIYTDEDRQKIQAEIGKLNENINKVVDNTTYKGHKLLTEDGQQPEETDGEHDIVAEILKNFAKEFGMKSFTAEAMGTDKVDVSSAEAAQNSMKIVEQAMKQVKDAMSDWKIFEEKNASYFELDAPEDSSSLINKPTMVTGTLELIKYNLLNIESQVLLDNSNQDTDRVTSLLK